MPISKTDIGNLLEMYRGTRSRREKFFGEDKTITALRSVISKDSFDDADIISCFFNLPRHSITDGGSPFRGFGRKGKKIYKLFEKIIPLVKIDAPKTSNVRFIIDSLDHLIYQWNGSTGAHAKWIYNKDDNLWCNENINSVLTSRFPGAYVEALLFLKSSAALFPKESKKFIQLDKEFRETIEPTGPVTNVASIQYLIVYAYRMGLLEDPIIYQYFKSIRIESIPPEIGAILRCCPFGVDCGINGGISGRVFPELINLIKEMAYESTILIKKDINNITVDTQQSYKKTTKLMANLPNVDPSSRDTQVASDIAESCHIHCETTSILENYKLQLARFRSPSDKGGYPELLANVLSKYECKIGLAPAKTPVKVIDDTVFDLETLLEWPEANEHHQRSHPITRELFTLSQIVPVRSVLDEMEKLIKVLNGDTQDESKEMSRVNEVTALSSSSSSSRVQATVAARNDQLTREIKAQGVVAEEKLECHKATDSMLQSRGATLGKIEMRNMTKVEKSKPRPASSSVGVLGNGQGAKNAASIEENRVDVIPAEKETYSDSEDKDLGVRFLFLSAPTALKEEPSRENEGEPVAKAEKAEAEAEKEGDVPMVCLGQKQGV